ncbi:MAG: carboxypeptidase-like regulatory domain-containing protein, partial [Terracidiphilus sp.]
MSKSHQTMRRIAAGLEACCLAMFLLAACTMHAQVAGSGTIQGTVTDATGAVVANAKVALTNTGSGVTHVTQSDGAGVFLFPNIDIATYNLKVTAAGFEAYEQTNMV